MDVTEKTDSDLTKEDNEDNDVALQNQIEEPSEKPPTCQFFLNGRCRFAEKCRNTHLSEVSAQSSASNDRPVKIKKGGEPKGKKPPMKTASDVISRIQWDSNLPKDHFSVGYLDRFLGVIEKPFSAFCWEDLASTGVDVLAIPKHRIQYFKYLELVVWDKTSRTDDVFGSTGGGMTILDIIEQYKTLVQAEQTSEEKAYVTSDALNNEDDVNSYCENHLDEGSHKKVRPTHFIAVRISSEDVRNTVKKIQNSLGEHNPEMAEYFTPLSELHLTLCLLHLETTDHIEIAHTVIQETKSEIQRLLSPSLILTFEGLKDFHSRVLYLSPASVPGLPSFINNLSQNFRTRGLTVIDPPSTNSFHVTVAKVPRNVASKNPGLLFLPTLYNSVQIDHFGAQPIDHLSFCYAGSSRRTDGFYSTLLEIPLY
ncbi:leukocyte receptor cluster member 9 isoform 1-T1 [Gastrophryne carolinensis]